MGGYIIPLLDLRHRRKLRLKFLIQIIYFLFSTLFGFDLPRLRISQFHRLVQGRPFASVVRVLPCVVDVLDLVHNLILSEVITHTCGRIRLRLEPVCQYLVVI